MSTRETVAGSGRTGAPERSAVDALSSWLIGVPRTGTHGDSALTKEEFVALVADKGGMAKAEAGRAVEAFCGAVAAAMEKGEAVRLPGFGGFELQERGERQGRNLRTGEA